MKKNRLALIVLACVLAEVCFGQTTYADVTKEIGIEHYYLNTSLGGGAAFFDYDNDGDDDLYLTGGSKPDKLYKNNGDGTFTDASFAAGIFVTLNFVTFGVITGDINNDGFRDILLTTTEPFPPHLLLNNGDGTFIDITNFSGLGVYASNTTAAAFGDFNLDGLIDIYIGNYIDKHHFIIDSMNTTIGFAHDCFADWIFVNNGDLTFTEVSAVYNFSNEGCTLAAVFTDYDNDHDPDLFIANDFGEWVISNQLFDNNYPDPVLMDVSEAAMMDAGMYGMGIAVGDYDHDHDLDYYVTNIARNGLFENQNNGYFLDQTAIAGVEDIYTDDSLFTVGWGTFFLDVDNDTWLDLFVSNGHVPAAPFILNSTINRNHLFYNNRDKTFTENTFASGLINGKRGRGCAYSDYDNDGDLDLVVVNVNGSAANAPIDSVYFYRNNLESEHNWLKVKLVGTIVNKDAYGAHLEIFLPGKSWVHEINGGSSHASQNSSIAHFGLGEHEMVDSLLITWPGGKKEYYTNLAANQSLTLVEGGGTSPVFENNTTNFAINIFPNPVSDLATIVFENPVHLKVNVQLMDMYGRVKKQWQGVNDPYLIFRNNGLAPGNYFINVFTEKGQHVTTKKINIQ